MQHVVSAGGRPPCLKKHPRAKKSLPPPIPADPMPPILTYLPPIMPYACKRMYMALHWRCISHAYFHALKPIADSFYAFAHAMTDISEQLRFLHAQHQTKVQHNAKPPLKSHEASAHASFVATTNHIADEILHVNQRVCRDGQQFLRHMCCGVQPDEHMLLDTGVPTLCISCIYPRTTTMNLAH